MNAPGVNQGRTWQMGMGGFILIPDHQSWLSILRVGMLKSLDQERDTFHSDDDVEFMFSDAGLTH